MYIIIYLFILQDLIKKCQRCMEVVIHAKDRQAAEANKNASILLQQIDLEKVSHPLTLIVFIVCRP